MNVLIAGVGNIFLGDDGFGVEVARRLAGETWRAGVTVGDFGVRGVHLAYQLLDGYDALILIDTVSRGGAPGTVYLIEADVDATPSRSPADAHDLQPETVIGMVKQLGGRIGCVYIVGGEAADLGEHIGLSEPVERAVPDAMLLVRRLVGELQNAATAAAPASVAG